MDVFCCEFCVLSGRGLCDELITRPEESYRLWCVVVCDPYTSTMSRPWPVLGRSAIGKGGSVVLRAEIITFAVHVLSVMAVKFLLFVKLRFRTNARNIPHLNHCAQ